eukprot:TRINITY_DN1389_c0_g1_i1.p1 TRINITY_DN1389_c0_g1~~TRINITY_DN1389_c0_g1_i1.p1  ORF type:complete len:241 (-),score=57.32 TRINITY_DN1389_c0_g1_i1:642-1364(-)
MLSAVRTAAAAQIAKRFYAISVASVKNVVAKPENTPGTGDYRVFFYNGDKKISPWHDIPLYANDEKTLLHFVSEMPRGTNAKMEIATAEAYNPIKQDVKKGALRFIKYGNTIINYGAIPQTWEDPEEKPDGFDGAGGDNDPIDVIEVGSQVVPQGGITVVKPIGVLALLDEGEVDWKLLTINASDPLASKINDVPDLNKHMPGVLENVHNWYRDYKIPDGKPANKYGFNGEAKGRVSNPT